MVVVGGVFCARSTAVRTLLVLLPLKTDSLCGRCRLHAPRCVGGLY